MAFINRNRPVSICTIISLQKSLSRIRDNESLIRDNDPISYLHFFHGIIHTLTVYFFLSFCSSDDAHYALPSHRVTYLLGVVKQIVGNFKRNNAAALMMWALWLKASPCATTNRLD